MPWNERGLGYEFLNGNGNGRGVAGLSNSFMTIPDNELGGPSKLVLLLCEWVSVSVSVPSLFTHNHWLAPLASQLGAL